MQRPQLQLPILLLLKLILKPLHPLHKQRVLLQNRNTLLLLPLQLPLNLTHFLQNPSIPLAEPLTASIKPVLALLNSPQFMPEHILATAENLRRFGRWRRDVSWNQLESGNLGCRWVSFLVAGRATHSAFSECFVCGVQDVLDLIQVY